MGPERAVTRREVLALGFGAGVTATRLGGPLITRAGGKEKTVKASYFAISALVQYYSAKEQGLFQAEGLKLEDTFVPGHLVMQSVISGQVDFTMASSPDPARQHLKHDGPWP